MSAEAIAAWHRLVRSGDAAGLAALLADDVVFHSPVVHSPQRGRKLVQLYLGAAFKVLGNDTFRYLREIAQGNTAVLEFEVVIDGLVVNGVDMIAWNEDGRITDFKVMIRPLKAIHLVQQKMAEMLEAAR